MVAENLQLIGKSTRQALLAEPATEHSGCIYAQNTGVVLQFMQVDPEIIPLTLGYMRAISFGVPFLFLYMALRNFNEGNIRD